MRYRLKFFLLGWFLFTAISLTAGNIVDGTFLLRQRKAELDKLLKKQYLLDRKFRAQIKASKGFLGDMIPWQSKISFQVFNFCAGLYEHKYGMLAAEGKHCRVFVEKEFLGRFGDNPATVIEQVKDTFDNLVYPTVTDWFGEPKIPQELNLPNEKIYIFLTDIVDQFEEGYIAGYFDHRDIEGLWGNQKPVFFMDIKPGLPGEPGDKNNPFYRTLAHEFQHMVNFLCRHNKKIESEQRWLDEGLAMFSEYIFSGRVGSSTNRFPPSPHLEKFLGNPQVNLTANSKESWFSEETLYRQYGGSFLFVWYLVEKYAGNGQIAQMNFVKELVDSSHNGSKGIDDVLNRRGSNFSEAFINWTMACYLDLEGINKNLWYFNNKEDSFGPSARAFPVNGIRHLYSKETSSFVGADGTSVPNSINAEQLTGSGTVNIKFMGDSGLTPYILRIGNDNTHSMQKIFLDASGTADILVDLDQNKKVVIAPVAIKPEQEVEDQYSYSYHANTSGLLLYPIPNPAFSDQFIVILKSFGKPITATPSLRISFNNIIDSPKFSPANDERNLFVAHYRVPGSGQGQAMVYSGEDSCSFSFSAVAARENVLNSVKYANASLSLKDNINNKKAVITTAAKTYIPTGCSQLSRAYNLMLEEDSAATLEIENADEQADGMVFVSSTNSTDWIPCNKSDNKLAADIKKSGNYFLANDYMAPQISNISLSMRGNNSCVVCFDAVDNISELTPDSANLLIDGNPVEVAANKVGNRFNLTLTNFVEGEHEFKISLEDKAGNRASKVLTQVLAGPLRLLQAIAYPNPCRSNAIINIQMAGAGANAIQYDAQAKIYDTAGHHLITIPLQDRGNGTLSGRWNCRTSSGKRVANGVYFFKAKIKSAGRSFKSTGKLAVLN